MLHEREREREREREKVRERKGEREKGREGLHLSNQADTVPTWMGPV